MRPAADNCSDDARQAVTDDFKKGILWGRDLHGRGLRPLRPGARVRIGGSGLARFGDEPVDGLGRERAPQRRSDACTLQQSAHMLIAESQLFANSCSYLGQARVRSPQSPEL